MTLHHKRLFAERLPLCLLSLALLIPACAPAAVLFSNFGAGRTYDITAGNPVGNAFDGNTYAEADSFRLSASGNLSSLALALSCAAFCPSTDSISVAFTNDNGNRPGAALESFTLMGSALGVLGMRNPAITLNSVLHPLLLMNTRYWVTVSSDLNDTVAWNLNSSGDISDEAISTDGAATWFSPSGQTPGALEVNATVPEPGSAALVITGILLGLSVVKRWRATTPRAVWFGKASGDREV